MIIFVKNLNYTASSADNYDMLLTVKLVVIVDFSIMLYLYKLYAWHISFDIFPIMKASHLDKKTWTVPSSN